MRRSLWSPTDPSPCKASLFQILPAFSRAEAEAEAAPSKPSAQLQLRERSPPTTKAGSTQAIVGSRNLLHKRQVPACLAGAGVKRESTLLTTMVSPDPAVSLAQRPLSTWLLGQLPNWQITVLWEEPDQDSSPRLAC